MISLKPYRNPMERANAASEDFFTHTYEIFFLFEALGFQGKVLSPECSHADLSLQFTENLILEYLVSEKFFFFFEYS